MWGSPPRLTCLTRPTALEALDDFVEGRARITPHGAHVAGADAGRPDLLTRFQPNRGLLRELGGARLQPLDDGVDLLARGAQLILQLGVEPLAEIVFTLAH